MAECYIGKYDNQLMMQVELIKQSVREDYEVRVWGQ